MAIISRQNFHNGKQTEEIRLVFLALCTLKFRSTLWVWWTKQHWITLVVYRIFIQSVHG